eukprot:5801399-Prorocentrum_lima.AAC.1
MDLDLSDPLQIAKQAGFLHFMAHEETEEGSMARAKLSPSMFPPTAEEAENMHLELCMRFLPHDLDTGGFFVAVLEKTAPLPSETVKADEAYPPAEDAQPGRDRPHGKGGSRYQDYRD